MAIERMAAGDGSASPGTGFWARDWWVVIGWERASDDAKTVSQVRGAN